MTSHAAMREAQSCILSCWERIVSTDVSGSTNKKLSQIDVSFFKRKVSDTVPTERKDRNFGPPVREIT